MKRKQLVNEFGREALEERRMIADIDGSGSSKTNSFESTVTSYNQSSAVPGWDFQ